MCHFDLPGLRYEPETAEKYKKIDSRLIVLPAVQTSKLEIIILVHCFPTIWPKRALNFGPFPLNYDLAGIIMGKNTGQCYYGSKLPLSLQLCWEENTDTLFCQFLPSLRAVGTLESPRGLVRWWYP